MPQAAPASFQLLEIRVVHDFVELNREQVIDLRDAHVDHGLGVFSFLCHMSKINVAVGDIVTPGQVVGLVGATGRVTGAHLHWALRVSGARVDPLALLALLGK